MDVNTPEEYLGLIDYKLIINKSFTLSSWTYFHLFIIKCCSIRLTLSSIKNTIVFRMILILFHTIILLTQNGISDIKIWRAVTINTEFTVTAVTLELRTVQQLQ
jgi:hypothetical protein